MGEGAGGRAGVAEEALGGRLLVAAREPRSGSKVRNQGQRPHARMGGGNGGV